MATRHYAEFVILDYSAEQSGFTFNFGAITAISLPGFLTDFGALRTALGNIILGTIKSEKWVGDETIISTFAPSNPDAQVELYWRVTYEESPLTNSSKYWVCQVGTPDVALLEPGTDEPDYTNANIAAFITAFENVVKSPFGGDIVITSIDFAGRRR